MKNALFVITIMSISHAIAGDNDQNPGLPICPENCGVTFNKRGPVTPKHESQKAPNRVGKKVA